MNRALLGLPRRAAVPYASVRRTANLSVAANTTVNPSFTEIESDAWGFWSPQEPSALTVPQGLGGIYLVGFNVTWNPNANFCWGWVTYRGGLTLAAAHHRSSGSGPGVVTKYTAQAVAELVDGDVMQAKVYHNHTGAVDLVADADFAPRLYCVRLAPYAPKP